MYFRIFYKSLLVGMILSITIYSYQYDISARQTKGSWWSGYVELKSITKRITVNPYFLDIEEDVVVSPYSTYEPRDNSNTLEITGSFCLPSQTVITGILIWDGDKILEGKLKLKNQARSEYESIVQRTVRDPIIVEKISEGTTMDQYNISIYPVDYKGSRKFRIRYLCPQRYISNSLQLQIPETFISQVYKAPEETDLNIKGVNGVKSIKLKYTTFKNDSISTVATYTLPAAIKVPSKNFGSGVNNSLYSYYNNKNNNIPAMLITLPAVKESMSVQTAFPDGLWKGNYIMYWGKPPDSLMINSGLHREIMFLWKWNFPNTFVYKENGSKQISQYGKDAILQADKIKQLTQNIVERGDKSGLLLDQGTISENKFFALSNRESSTFDSLSAFLSGIDSSYFLSRLDGVDPPIKIRIPENEQMSFLKKNSESFDVSIKLICSVFSKNDKIIKHIVIVTTGPAPEMPNLEDYYLKSDTLLKNITVSSYGSSQRYPTGYWPGVPLYKIVENHALLETGILQNGFWIPVKKNARIQMSINNASRSYSTDLINIAYQRIWSSQLQQYQYTSISTNVDTCFFSGHSFSKWDNKITWNAFDSTGVKLGTYSYIPETIDNTGDTFIAKLWAGTKRPVAEGGYELNRGARFGIVDAQFSLLALEGDTVTSIEKNALGENGLPFLTRDDIYFADSNLTPVQYKLQKARGNDFLSIVRINNNKYRIHFPSNCKILSITIVNIQGRVVVSLNKKILSGKSYVDCNFADLSKGIYRLVAITSQGPMTKSFSIF